MKTFDNLCQIHYIIKLTVFLLLNLGLGLANWHPGNPYPDSNPIPGSISHRHRHPSGRSLWPVALSIADPIITHIIRFDY